MIPEIRRSKVLHNSVHSPASKTASAFRPSLSNLPATASRSNWRSHWSEANSSNQRMKAASSAGGSFCTSFSSSARLMPGKLPPDRLGSSGPLATTPANPRPAALPRIVWEMGNLTLYGPLPAARRSVTGFGSSRFGHGFYGWTLIWLAILHRCRRTLRTRQPSTRLNSASCSSDRSRMPGFIASTLKRAKPCGQS